LLKHATKSNTITLAIIKN